MFGFSMASGLLACSWLAPSDEELTGGVELVGGDGGATRPSAGAGTSGVGGPSGSGGSDGSDEGVGAHPLLPVGGSGASPAGVGAPSSVTPDAGPSEPLPCVDCETVRFTGAVGTVELGTPGGSLYLEICPRDQVVVGMDYRYAFGTPADFGYFTSVALVCGELAPNRDAGSLDVIVGAPLTPRGAGSGVAGVGGRCPVGQVVTGFEGARNFDGTTSEIREFILHCAPIALAADTALAVGAALPTQPMSASFAVSTVPPDEIMSLQPCPDGQVVRGAAVHAGTWVDGISLICSAPVLAQPDGRPCSSALECQSGSCAGSCQPRACAAPAGCSCGLREQAQYAFCAAAQPQSAAAEQCAASGMHLATAEDPIAHGWLRTSTAREGIQSAFWLGADDLVSEGVWTWAQGAGAVDLASELWDENELRGGADENCMAMTRDGHWDDVACELALPFVCEAPPP